VDKKFISLDKQKVQFKVFNIISIGLLSLIFIIALFYKMLPGWFVNVCFYSWISFFVLFLICDLLFYLHINKSAKNALKSKYLFDRNISPENIQTKFKDCILQEVEFFEDGFVLHGLKTAYSDVNLEYSIYGDNIMFHIYNKGEEVNPLLVFIVTEEMFYMVKKFNLNLELLNKEIDFLNLNKN